MSAKRNIDAVLGAVSQGHGEAEKRNQPKPKPDTKPSKGGEMVVATFTFSADFLGQVRRLGLDWRDRAIPASGAREGAVIQALAQAALESPAILEKAFALAKGRKG